MDEKHNSGDYNTGYYNSGDRNTGHYNTGHYNTGHRNSGDCNTGDCNTGDCNTGHRNSGDNNSGHRNSGDNNSGHYNSGHYNSGHYNSGHYNSGHYNTGRYNTGHYNSGDRNSGHRNSGDYNTGYYNSGDRNSGHYNTGHYNTGHRNSGFFCTETPAPLFFDRPTNLTWDEAQDAIPYVDVPIGCKWVCHADMTPGEQAEHPNSAALGGYLKVLEKDFRVAFPLAWAKLDAATKQRFLDLPNFDADKFFAITGVDVRPKPTPSEVFVDGHRYVLADNPAGTAGER